MPGAFADLVIFDPATVADTATFNIAGPERCGNRPRNVHGPRITWSHVANTGAAAWKGPLAGQRSCDHKGGTKFELVSAE